MILILVYSEEGPARSASPSSPLLAVPNVNSPPINGQCTNFILLDVSLYVPLHCKELIFILQGE